VRPVAPALAAVLAAGMSLVALGCAPTHLNERLAIGTGPTASFETGTPPAAPLTMRAETSRPRRSWDTLVDGSPIDGVVHGLPFRTRPPVTRRDDGHRVGAYPDPLDTERARPSESVFGAVFDLGRAVSDAVFLGVRSVTTGVRGGERWGLWSPRTIWKRTHADRSRVGTIPPARRDAPDPQRHQETTP